MRVHAANPRRRPLPNGCDYLVRTFSGILASSFKAAFGETPHQYLLTRRLERAASLLRSTDYSVAAICMEVGLAIVGSFTTSFKRVYGRTPTEYRADHPPAGSSSFEEDRGRD